MQSYLHVKVCGSQTSKRGSHERHARFPSAFITSAAVLTSETVAYTSTVVHPSNHGAAVEEGRDAGCIRCHARTQGIPTTAALLLVSLGIAGWSGVGRLHPPLACPQGQNSGSA